MTKEEKMTIDECIEIWTHPTQYFSSKREEAVDFAINTLRKYQKIKEILNDDSYYEDYGSKAESFIVSAISEVIEDGKA